MSDPAKYRKDGELDGHRKEHDGLKLAETRLADMGVSEEDLKAIRDRVNNQAKAAYAFAEESPLPDPKKLYDYTYSER